MWFAVLGFEPEAENRHREFGPHRQRTGDVASLIGRILRAAFVLFVGLALVAAGPLQAAPFAAIVMDARTGEILYQENADTRLHPASLTKMMTLYIVFQEIEAGNLSLDTKVTVSEYAAAQPPSRLGLKPGQKIAVRYLIRAAAVKSANDAASALGDAIGGDHVAFAKRMTKTARALGMDNTTFKNANGLTAEGHLSTAHDMNILGRHLFYDFPEYFNIFSRRTADAGIATVTNTNSRFLDSYEGADGIKTGYTSPAGFNLTASAHRGDKHIIATIFGGTSSANRNAKMGELMDLGFDKARSGVAEQPTTPAGIPDDALIAALETGIDEIDAEGGAGKVIRVSGEVLTSLRPKPRPERPTVSDDVALAMAAGIDGALAEATAEPAPAGTLEAQVETLADAAALVDPATAPETEAPADIALAAAEPVADLPNADLPPDPALVGARPMPRPTDIAPASVDVAEVAPETVVTDPGTAPEADPVALLAEASTDDLTLADVTAVETVLGAVDTVAPEVELAAATITAPVADPVILTAEQPDPTRAAPIFDDVVVAEAETPAEPEVVVVVSTSGGRHFGVNVGEFPTRYDAERALLKTALAESATLNEGLRKTTQSGDVWRASFMGLTEEQAELACRRLIARAVPCETLGG